jgi:hypothetical protein
VIIAAGEACYPWQTVALYTIRFPGCESAGRSVSRRFLMWKFLKYSWVVIRNLLTIGVALLCFEKAEGAFQVITVALLMLIYVQVLASSTNTARMNLALTVGLADEFYRIRQLLKDESSEIEGEEPSRPFNDLLSNTQAEYYINMTGAGIIALIAIFNLVATL